MEVVLHHSRVADLAVVDSLMMRMHEVAVLMVADIAERRLKGTIGCLLSQTSWLQL
jgi:hypothetical protein